MKRRSSGNTRTFLKVARALPSTKIAFVGVGPERDGLTAQLRLIGV